MYLREVDEKILGAGAGGIAGAALGAYLARRKNSRFERKKTQRDRLMKYVGAGGVAGSAVGAGLGAIYQKFANKKNAEYKKALSKAAQDTNENTAQISSRDLKIADKFIEAFCHKLASKIENTATIDDEFFKKMKNINIEIDELVEQFFKLRSRVNNVGSTTLAFILVNLSIDTTLIFSEIYGKLLQHDQFDLGVPKDYKKKFTKLLEKEYPKIIKSNFKQSVAAYHATLKKSSEKYYGVSSAFLESDTFKEIREKNERELKEITNKTFGKTS